jgi:hypothetical protein
MAKLNMAKSRVRRSSCNLARIDYTCLGCNGGFGPVSLPLFHAGLTGLAHDGGLLSFMVSLLLRDLPDCDGGCQLDDFAAASEVDLPCGVLVAYAAKHVTVAEDGSGANSPFAEAMLENLEGDRFSVPQGARPGAYGHQQAEPFLYGSLPSESLYFKFAAPH